MSSEVILAEFDIVSFYIPSIAMASTLGSSCLFEMGV